MLPWSSHRLTYFEAYGFAIIWCANCRTIAVELTPTSNVRKDLPRTCTYRYAAHRAW